MVNRQAGSFGIDHGIGDKEVSPQQMLTTGDAHRQALLREVLGLCPPGVFWRDHLLVGVVVDLD